MAHIGIIMNPDGTAMELHVSPAGLREVADLLESIDKVRVRATTLDLDQPFDLRVIARPD